MEPDSSRDMPEQNPNEEEPGNWVRDFRSRVMTKEVVERFMSQVRESAESVLKLTAQWEMYKKAVELKDKSSKKEIFELKNKIGLLEEEIKLKEEEFMKVFEEREKNVEFHEVFVNKRFGLLQEKDKEMKLKEEALEMQILEFKMKEDGLLKVAEAREKKIGLLEVSIKERLRLLQEKEKEFDLKQLLEAVVMRLVLEMQKEERVTQINEQEKLLQDSMKQKHEKLMRELEARKEKVDLLSKLTDEKRCELERKVTDFDLKQIVGSDRIREEAELNLKRLEARENELEKKELKQKEEAREIEAKAKFLELKEKELNERERKIEEASVQAETRKRSRPSLLAEKGRETDSLIPPAKRHKLIGEHNPIKERVIPVACGVFNYGDTETIDNHLTFSHEMKNFTLCGRDITIYPRKGEIWSLFRDWTEAWINERELHQPPYRYDFVEVLSEFDSEQGIGVAYLGAVKGFTSVYVHAEQHGFKQMMISAESMLKFSHKVPHVKLNGDEKEVPPDSFELDPAAIPRAYLRAATIKEESLVLDLGF